jgi:protein-tyrosine-phosphatase
VAERATVARVTGVRFSPSALKKEKMKILFICKYNAFRSRIAEEYFKKINKNKKIQSISRGFIVDGNADSEQVELAKNLLGINITKRNPISIKLKDLKESDLIIVVADDVPKMMFNYKRDSLIKKIIFWGIKDEQYKNERNIKNIIFQIKERVENLNETLEERK